MSRVLIASITQLCVADHAGDPETIAAWTANKTEQGVRQMLATPGTEMLVAERLDQLVAVGALNGDAVTLNYVDPAHRRTGVSRLLLAALEQSLVARGVRMGRLKSTATARDFYRSQGWIEDPPLPKGRFIAAHSMHKVLLV